MPVLENAETPKLGNLYILFEVEYPQSISGNTKKILWQLLNNTPYKEISTNGQKFILESVDKYKSENTRNSRGGVNLPPGFKAHFNGDDSGDDDDNDMHGSGPGTECKVQ